MSFVTTVPEAMKTAASALHNIGDQMADSSAVAGKVMTAVVAPGADEVSQRVVGFVRTFAADYHEVSLRAQTAYDLFVTSLSDSAEAYSSTEVDNATRIG